MALDPALLQPATRWPGPTGGDSSDDDDTPPPPAPAADARAEAPQKARGRRAGAEEARPRLDGRPARARPARRDGRGARQHHGHRGEPAVGHALFQETDIGGHAQWPGLARTRGLRGGGTIYALCFSEDSNPGTPDGCGDLLRHAARKAGRRSSRSSRSAADGAALRI